MWADTLTLDRDIAAVRAAAAGFDGALAGATVVYAADDAPDHLDAARAMLQRVDGRAGATAVGGLLLVRFLARDGQAMRRDLTAFVAAFRAHAAGLPATVPKVWLV